MSVRGWGGMEMVRLAIAVIVIGVISSAIFSNKNPEQEIKASREQGGSAVQIARKAAAPTNQPPKKAWYVHSFSSEMDGRKIWNATTDDAYAYGQLSWPVKGTKAYVTVGKDRGSLFVLFVFSTAPNLVGGVIENGYTVHRLPISFDGEMDSLTVTQKWGSPNLYAKYPGWLIKKMKEAKEIKIKLPWYHQSQMYFRFGVSGLAEALKQFK